MNKFKLFVFVCSVVLYPVNCFCMDPSDKGKNAITTPQQEEHISVVTNGNTIFVVDNSGQEVPTNNSTPTQKAKIVRPSTPGVNPNPDKVSSRTQEAIDSMKNSALDPYAI